MTEKHSLVLTALQIDALAEFAKSEGQPSYTITHTTIPQLEADDGTIIPEYSGLIAYSESEDHSVLQLGDWLR